MTLGLPSESEDEDYFIKVPDHGEDEDRVSEASDWSGFKSDFADELASDSSRRPNSKTWI